MKHKLFFLLLVTALLLRTSSGVYAEDFSLRVSPATLTIQTDAPKIIEKYITITNNTSTPSDLQVIFQPFTQADTNRGIVTYSVNKDIFFHTDPLIFEKIQLYDGDTAITGITLAPKEQKKLRLHIALTEKEKNADYYFSILLVSNPSSLPLSDSLVIASETKQSSTKEIATSLTAPRNDILAQSIIKPAIGMNVLLSIYSGKKTPEGIIDTYSAPLFIPHGPVPLSVIFKNTGPYLLIPQGTILIRNMFGQVVGNVIIPPANVLANTQRILPAIWKEQFLLGPYTAELHLTFADDKSVSFTRSIMFFAAPTEQTISIICLIVIYILIKGRLNKYRKEHI